MTNVVDVQCNVLANLWSLAGQLGLPPTCVASNFISPAVLVDHSCDTLVNVVDTQLAVLFALGAPLSSNIDANMNQCADACESDLDLDGVFDLLDCAPQDPNISPLQPETCNAVDDNCDGLVDDGAQAALDASCADANLCDGAEICTATDPVPAGLFISEIHSLPQVAPGPSGQWIELVNTSSELIDIRGYILANAIGALHVIDPGGAFLIPPQGRIVISSNIDYESNGGVRSIYSWGPFTLNAAAGTLQLRDTDSAVVDEVVYTSAETEPGKSLSRLRFDLPGTDPTAFGISDLLYGFGDRGTPGGANRDVLASPCMGTAVVDCGESDDCTVATCDPATGGCIVDVAPNGSTCDDDNACTGGDFCSAGACTGIPLANCCGNGFCEPGELCSCAADCDGQPCNDLNDCTTADVCTGGECNGVPAVGCCGNGFCEPGEPCGCVDDCLGSPCTAEGCLQGATCQADGTCGGGFPVAGCCGNGFCEPGELCDCAEDCEGLDCDDGDAGTIGETCQPDGTCGGGAGGCENGTLDGSETAVDCGGPECPGCAGGLPCDGPSDCLSGVCEGGLCATDADCTPLGFGSNGALGPLVVNSSALFNTSTGAVTVDGVSVLNGSENGIETVSQPSGGLPWSPPQLRVYHFQDIAVAAGATVEVTGTRGLALLSTGSVTVAGEIDASGTPGQSGGQNSIGNAGAAGPGGGAGGKFTSGIGCTFNNGVAAGPGAGQSGACGGKGQDGSDQLIEGGGGAGGGGGGCGASGGAGAGHATAGGTSESGAAGLVGETGNTGNGVPGGSGGSQCASGGGPASGGNPYGSPELPQLYGGTGGSSGGFGGRGGTGGRTDCFPVDSFGGIAGLSGGPGGGGGGGGVLLICAGVSIDLAPGSDLDVGGGFGGYSGFSQLSENGDSAFVTSDSCAGGGGAGGSGRGGSAGGGSGGSMRLAAPSISAFGLLDAGGGGGGSSTLTFTGFAGFGGVGKGGAGSGGKGGKGGGAGAGGDGGDGYIRIETNSFQNAATIDGVFTTGEF